MGRISGMHRRPSKPGGIWYFGYRGLDGKWREVSTGKSKYADAVAEKTRRLPGLVKTKRPVQYNRLKVGEAFDLWLQGLSGKIKQYTMHSYRQCSAKPKELLGGTKLEDLTIENVEWFQATRQQDGLRGRSINMETDVLRMMLKRFDHWHEIGKKFVRLNEDDSELGKALTPEQTAHMLEIGEQDIRRRPILLTAKLLLSTGLRTCELKQLRIGQIDLFGAKLRVQRKTTKSDAGSRTVPLNHDAIAAIRGLLIEARKHGATQPDHFLFPHQLSRHTQDDRQGERGWNPEEHQTSFRTAWESWMKDAGLKEFRLHDLRHTFITRCAERGVPLELTRSIVGHMSNEMTRYYTHICPDAKLNVVRSVDFLKIPPASASRQEELENTGQVRLLQ